MQLATRGAVAPQTAVTIGQLNAWNLFDAIDDPGIADDVPTQADVDIRLTKVAGMIGGDMGAPDVVTLQEVENEHILELLTKHPALARFGYRFAIAPQSDPRGIRNAVIYRADRVETTEVVAPNPDSKLDPEHPGTPIAKKLFSRPPLAVTFRQLTGPGDAAVGASFVVISNHFKSKLGGEEFEQRRRDQGSFLGGLVDSLAGTHNVVVSGDLNATYEDGAYQRVERREDGTQRMVDTLRRLPDPDRYTYLYKGQKNLLDHLMVPVALESAIESVKILHLNSGTHGKIRFDPSTTRGASDHDPIVASFRFPTR